MELSTVLKRIEQRLKAVELSADAASKQAGKPDAIRNLRRAARKGSRGGLHTQTIDALAPVLRTTAAWLLEGKGPRDTPEGAAPTLTVPVKGYVGAGAEAHYYAVAQGDLDDVAAPAGATDHTVAVEIRGESLGPLFDRWLVFYDDVRRPVTADLMGRLCVVGLADDRILVKKIRPGRRGRFRLLSTPPEPPIEDAEVEWAAPVRIMTPR